MTITAAGRDRWPQSTRPDPSAPPRGRNVFGWHPREVRIEPTTRTGRDRQGRCRLCGRVAALTRTHIPPRAAGNQGPAREAVVVTDRQGNQFHTLGRPSGGGGMWRRWFCESCNSRTGRWEEEYIVWGFPVLQELHRQEPAVGEPLALQFDDADPGALGRMLWAWMFAVDDGLREQLPDIADAILTGHPVEPPPNLRVLVGATTDLRLWLVGQRGGKALRTMAGRGVWHETTGGVWTTGPEDVPIPHAAIASPPLVVLLADASHNPHAPYFDASEWLNEPPGLRRCVTMFLPVVRAFDAEGEVTLLTYEQLV
jgi:hypothetical protein